jgi:hypothetical protein
MRTEDRALVYLPVARVRDRVNRLAVLTRRARRRLVLCELLLTVPLLKGRQVMNLQNNSLEFRFRVVG